MSFTINTNEDEEDFTPSTNSNLASIFQDSGPIHSSTKSLIYTAPKQPTNKPQSPMAGSSSQGVAAATAVTCYRLNNDKYEPLPGKIGLALLANHDSKMYTMILYQNKQKPMASVRITSEFSLTSQPDNFCSFYDDQRQNWAVLFDSKDSSQHFLQEIDKIKSLLGRDGKPSLSAVKEPSPAPSSSDRLDGASMNSSHSSSSPAVNNNSSITESQKTKLISRIAKLGQPILPLKGAAVAEESGSEQLQSSPEPTEPVLERASNKQNKKFSRPVPAARPNVIAPPMNETNNFNVNAMALSTSSQFHPYHQQGFPVMQYVPAFSGATSVGNNNHFDILLSETRTQNSEIRMNLCRLTDKVDLALQKNTGFEPQPVMRTSEISREPDMVAHLQKLHSQASGQSDKLDRILEWITSQEQSRQITYNTQHDSAELTELWATKEKEAEASIQHLKTENSRLLKQWEEAVQQRDDSFQENVKLKSVASSLQTLEKENAKLKSSLKEKEVALEQNSRLSASKVLEEEDERISRFQEENARLSDLLDNVRKDKNLAEVQLEEKLAIYQSKCGEMESHLRELKSLVGEKEEAIQQLQSKNSRLEREALDSRNLSDTLKSKLEASEKPQDGGAAVEEQVKVIMNKLYKQALKQFQPEESYSFQNIKASLSSVIRDVTLAVLNGEALQSTPIVGVAKTESVPEIQVVPIEEVSAKDPVTEHSVMQDEEATTIIAASSPLNGETGSLKEEELLDSNKLDTEEGNKGRSVSFLETLHNTLAAAQSSHEPTWKPEPPPPPLFDDFEEDDDDWLA